MLNFESDLESHNLCTLNNRLGSALLANAKETPLDSIETSKIFKDRNKQYKSVSRTKSIENTPSNQRSVNAKRVVIDRLRFEDGIIEEEEDVIGGSD